jgi:hypothetical protein
VNKLPNTPLPTSPHFEAIHYPHKWETRGIWVFT